MTGRKWGDLWVFWYPAVSKNRDTWEWKVSDTNLQELESGTIHCDNETAAREAAYDAARRLQRQAEGIQQ